MDHIPARRERLRRRLQELELEGILVANRLNVSYLTGFSGDSSYLLLDQGRCLVVSDGRYTEQLQEECPGLELEIRPPSIKLPPATASALQKLGWRSIGFESMHLSVAEFGFYQDAVKQAAWKPCVDLVESQRAVKDPSEIAQIREAIAMAERAFRRLRQSLSPNDTEKQLANRIEMLVREEGAQCTAFSPIVGVGPRAALPHAPLSDRRAGEGEMLLVDWGAAGRFYRSDLTRTLAPHKISPKLEEVYEVVSRAQRQAIAMVRPGMKASEVDAAARAVMEEAGYGPFFNHGLGHGFGLEIHEAPALRPGSDHVLEPGMVTTIEPGIYLPGWGGVRIEDDLVVTPDGCEVLSSLPRALADLVLF